MRGGVLRQGEQDADAGLEVLTRTDATHVAVQATQSQRVAGSGDDVSSRL